jgi:hypothetical protein
MDLRGLDERSGFGAPGYVRWLREQETHEAEAAVRAFQAVVVHTLRMSQTITRTTIMVPSNPKPSILFLL